jgi:hypothetical protein
MKNGWFSKTATKSEPSTLSRKAEAEDATKEFGHDQIDSHIANALTQLSTQERDKVYHQLHGVDDVIEETPEFVSQKLQVFDTELGKVRVRHKKGEAIQLAQSMDPEYVSDPGLRLKFLRADSFNVEKAVDRMVRFFDIKLYLFGKDKLCLDITMKELSPADRATLKAGFMQLLPVRDRAGRAVFMLLPSFQTYEEPENMVRFYYYVGVYLENCFIYVICMFVNVLEPHRLVLSDSGHVLYCHEWFGRFRDTEKRIYHPYL